MRKPYIIEIEGTDGSGKQTQTELLYNFLCNSGYKCLKLSFPNYESLSGEIVKQYLSGELGKINPVTPYQASVLYALNRVTTLKTVDIANYDFLVLDRYTGSNMIHQAANINPAELEDFLLWLEDLEFNKLSLPRPNLVLFLDVPSAISFKLASARTELKTHGEVDILEQNKNHIDAAYNNAKKVAKRCGWQTVNCTLNGKMLSIEQIANSVLAIVKLNAKI